MKSGGLEVAVVEGANAASRPSSDRGYSSTNSCCDLELLLQIARAYKTPAIMLCLSGKTDGHASI